jgi:hypothetical protein
VVGMRVWTCSTWVLARGAEWQNYVAYTEGNHALAEELGREALASALNRQGVVFMRGKCLHQHWEGWNYGLA